MIILCVNRCHWYRAHLLRLWHTQELKWMNPSLSPKHFNWKPGTNSTCSPWMGVANFWVVSETRPNWQHYTQSVVSVPMCKSLVLRTHSLNYAYGY